MKTVRILIALAATVAPSRASTIVTATPLDIGIPYRHTITMEGSDGASVIRHFGAWCWEDDELFNPANGEAPVGWTHTVRVGRTHTDLRHHTHVAPRTPGGGSRPTAENPANIAGVNSMFPSFTVYGGWDQDGDQHHTFNNRGAIAWAEDVTIWTTWTTRRSPWLSGRGVFRQGIIRLSSGATHRPPTPTARVILPR